MWQELFSFFNQGWVGSLIGVIGIVLGAIGIFSYKISRSTAKPAYQKSSLRLLGRSDDNFPKDVTVLFKGHEVERLTKTTLIFWNNGTEVLNGEDVVDSDTICISLKDGDNILSYKILKRTKDVNNVDVVKDEKNSNQIWVDFAYLDPDDGFTIELLHDSEERYPIISGTIKGQPGSFEDLGRVYPNRIPSNKISSSNPLRIVFDRPKLVFSVAILIGVIMFTIGLLPQELGDRFLTGSNEGKVKLDSSWFFIIFGLVYAALPASMLWFRRKKYPKSLEIEEVEP